MGELSLQRRDRSYGVPPRKAVGILLRDKTYVRLPSRSS